MKTVQDLKSIQSQAILRLNCPGYGQALALAKDGAQVLTDYRAIIVNPLSILHLFEGQSDALKQIDVALNDGVTSYKLANDDLINKIATEIDTRSKEILEFLAAGGLLVYYLCRPFELAGKSRFLDNYAWLCGLAPDQSGQSTIGERTKRHMSTVAHGRNVDKTEAGENSEFSKYFDQPGLEWNTIIRGEFLTEGYTPLATAGPKKCIAGQLLVGEAGGQIVFLPAPYSQDFDRTLIDCIYQWHTNHLAQGSKFAAAEETLPEKKPAGNEDDKTGSINPTPTKPDLKAKMASVISPKINIKLEPKAAPKEQPNIEAKAPPKPPSKPQVSLDAKPASIPKAPLAGSKSDEPPAPRSAKLKELFAAQAVAPEPAPEKEHTSTGTNGQDKQHSAPPAAAQAQKDPVPPPTQKASTSPIAHKASPQSSSQSSPAKVLDELKNSLPPSASKPEPAKKMVLTEEAKSSWAHKHVLLGIGEMIKEVEIVQVQINQLQKQIISQQETIQLMDTVKVPLLAGKGGSLVESCKVTLNALDWTISSWGNNPNDLLLSENGQTVALAHIAVSKGQVERTELARLVEVLINYWNEHTGEPKGIFIACPFADTPFEQRQDAEFSTTEVEFAEKKNICLLTTAQLLHIYRDIRLGRVDVKSVHQKLIACNGCLPGFTE